MRTARGVRFTTNSDVFIPFRSRTHLIRPRQSVRWRGHRRKGCGCGTCALARWDGGLGPLLPLGTKSSFQINLDNDGFQQITLPAAATASTVLTDIATAVQTAVTALKAQKTSTSAGTFTGFTCTVNTVSGQPQLVLQSGSTSATSSVAVQAASANDVTGLLKLGAGNRSEEHTSELQSLR